MRIEATHEADIVCRDIIGEAYEAYEAAYEQNPDGMFSGGDELWVRIEGVLARKGTLDLCTTGSEDGEAQTVLEEVFEEACRAADEDGRIASPSEYVDYKALWERICEVIGVSV